MLKILILEELKICTLSSIAEITAKSKQIADFSCYEINTKTVATFEKWKWIWLTDIHTPIGVHRQIKIYVIGILDLGRILKRFFKWKFYILVWFWVIWVVLVIMLGISNLFQFTGIMISEHGYGWRWSNQSRFCRVAQYLKLRFGWNIDFNMMWSYVIIYWTTDKHILGTAGCIQSLWLQNNYML